MVLVAICMCTSHTASDDCSQQEIKKNSYLNFIILWFIIVFNVFMYSCMYVCVCAHIEYFCMVPCNCCSPARCSCMTQCQMLPASAARIICTQCNCVWHCVKYWLFLCMCARMHVCMCVFIYIYIRGLIHKSWQLFFFSRKCANTGNLIYTFESV
jgi:hypothetical protein